MSIMLKLFLICSLMTAVSFIVLKIMINAMSKGELFEFAVTDRAPLRVCITGLLFIIFSIGTLASAIVLIVSA